VVHVEKDVEKKRWVVSTTALPRQEIVVIPWADAFRTYTDAQHRQYENYIEAVTTCQSHETTALTRAEEREVLRELEGGAVAPPVVKPASAPVSNNVVSLDAFKKRKKP
jgi:hypothetical protein